MKPDLTGLLGERLSVCVDRPLGSAHPLFPHGEPYAVTYGFLPGTRSGDGEPIDAHLVGWPAPIERGAAVDGAVIALVVREDDDEDKLIVVPALPPAGARPDGAYAARLRAAIDVQERHFRSRLVLWPGPAAL